MACRFLFRLVEWLIFLGFSVLFLHLWLVHKDYLFTEQAIASIAKKYMGLNIADSQKLIHRELSAQYPSHILAQQDLQWVFFNAGGLMGSMCLMHASITEYVLIFGSAVETVGHSGRFWANISRTILTGNFRQWKEEEFEVTIHEPGDTVKLVWGEATIVNLTPGTWMLEYGRGFLPSTIGYAFADTIFSTQDFVGLFYICKVYMKFLALEWSKYLTLLTDYVLKLI